MRRFEAKTLIVLTLYAVLLVNISAAEKANLTDVRKCRVTHAGTEYTGPISKTASGIRCQFWEKKYTAPEISQGIEDKLFPDGSKSLAKNWCRNPGGQQDEPWCYTRQKKLTEDYCDVPLCIYHGCRLTGPGVEYAGKVDRSSSEQECRPWTDRHKDIGAKKAYRFPNSAFPERSRRNAKRRCRNPDGDPGGPWCYVDVAENEYQEEEKSDDEKHEKGAKVLKSFEEEKKEEEEEDEGRVEREYCDVPFCDEKDCMVYTTEGAGPVTHSHWTALADTRRNISLAVKLWRPEEWHRVRLHLALSVLAVPSSESQIQEWQAGVELTLSNTKSGIVAGGKNKALVSTPGLVWGTRWTQIWIRWGEGYISMGKESNSTPLISEEYKDKAGLLGLNPGAFNYYSIFGEGVMWSFPFCDTDCEVQTTTQLDFIRFWPLKRMTKTHEATFFVRATHSACVELRVSPAVKYPHIWLMMSGRKNLTQLILQRTANSRQIVLQGVKVNKLLSYWKWEEFSISVFGDSLSVFWTRDVGTQTLIEAGHEVVRRMRWISPGSLSTAHWTLFCHPPEGAQVPAAVPPECLISETEGRYMGSQWTTMMGQPCLPWVYVTGIINSLRNDQLFEDGSVVAALNYCRNPTRDRQGPFCFVQDTATNLIQQEYCYPRKCQASECRIAGTGNDYIGQLNVTRSKRTCQRWVENIPHVVNVTYRNETLFPDRSVEEARNYCRDPSHNIAGSWCYTVDPKVPQDVCDVRDCVKPEECTMMTRGVGEGRLIYIRNKWRKEGLKFWLKEWDPDRPDGIIFVVRPLSGDNYYKLIIGANENENVQLYYGEGKGNAEVLLKEKTLPHLIPIGKWGGFWLRIPTGRISLGYEGLDNYLFDWEHNNVFPTEGQRHEVFKPMFITFTSVKGYTIGVNFPCDECHTEKTSTKRFTKILPLGLWSKEQGSHNSLTLHIRGTGVAVIPLIKLPGLGQYYGLTIGDKGNRMYYIKQEGKKITTLTATKISGPMMYKDKWTVFHISYNETNFSVKRNGERLLRWKHNEPMLFYWFSLGAENGEITWSANCDPEDIDGDPRNGGWSEWSPWTCSVTCGGGEGVSTRTCTNPVPNVYGEDCIGDDKIEGDCNNFKCGEISPDTMEYLRDLLRKHHQSLQPLQGDQVELICHQEALSKIQAEAPTSKIKWALNGMTISPDGTRVIITNNSNLVISSAQPRDSGVYTCIVFQESGFRSIISVASLAVKPKTPTISTRETQHITLHCHSEVLGYIYTDLALKWEFNGKLWKDYGLITLAAVNIEELQHVKYSHAGEWKCIIQQPDLNFEWVTNWILVEVKHAPNFLTYLMEDPLPAHLFKHFEDDSLVLAFLIGFLLLTILVVAAGTYMYLRWCRLQ